MRLALALTLVPALLAAQADTSRLRAVPNPRTTAGSWVLDPAGHLRPETRARLDSLIGALERETTAEIAVAVLDSLDGLEPADAALALHRRWGVGKRERDNGVVLLWSPALRRIQVSVGYGLEGVLPDARAGRIQDEAMLPAFRRGNFDAGVLAGVAALADAAREETYSGLQRASSLQRRGGRLPGILGTILGAFGLAGLLLWIGTGRYPRRCPRGHGFMKRLSERADNAKLERAQQLEERLGSVNYDVWVCSRCDATRLVTHRKLFSGYERCPTCHRRTVKPTTKQLVAATYSSTGTREVYRRCRNCSFERRTEETIPQLVHSSSDSSSSGGGGGGFSGGSSFGGGSSGGGGAGRSY